MKPAGKHMIPADFNKTTTILTYLSIKIKLKTK
jgi:hypothetical protein